MKYFKYTPYVYLFLVPFLLYSGITKLNSNESSWLYFFMAAGALVMFFVRLQFVKKYEANRKKEE